MAAAQDKAAGGRRPLRILVIGGTGFMGRAVVRALRDSASRDRFGLPDLGALYLVNRGHTYWRACDDQIWEAQRQFEESAWIHLPCTRKDPQQFGQLLRETDPRPEAERDGNHPRWDAVIDFCAYKPSHIQPILETLTGQIGLYVLISTDSVYEVCPEGGGGEGQAAGRVEEEDRRPEDPERRRQLREDDTYGDDKLRCEELLREHRAATGFAFVALRLCDVIGPFDDTDRFWASQMLVQACAERGWPLPVSRADRRRQMSFTFSQDVASAILAALAAPVETIAGHSFNIACHERCTNAQLFEMIADSLGVPVQLVDPQRPERRQRRRRKSSSGSCRSDDSSSSSSSASSSCSSSVSSEEDDSSSDEDTDSDADHPEDDDGARESRESQRRRVWESAELPLSQPRSYFPSVTFGCVDGRKAERLLPGYRATGLAEAMRKTVDFFREAGRLYPSEWRDASRNLPKGSPVREWYRHLRRKAHPPQPSDEEQDA